MVNEQFYNSAIKRLEEAKIYLGNKEIKPLVAAKSEVLMQFQPIFATKHLPDLTEAEFRSFLQFKHNKHWSGIHRQGSRMCKDMNQLRHALLLLLDQKQPIAKRYDQAVQSIPGMGKAVATALLHIVEPEQYGIWNTIAERSLKELNLWPKPVWGASEGQNYAKLNERLMTLTKTLHIDLWTLDALWWVIDYNEGNA